MDLVDSDGKPTGVMPAILLVPTALSAMGTQLYKSVELRDTTANTKFPVANPHQGKFRIEVSRYLSNALYTGNSAKAWYLLADPTPHATCRSSRWRSSTARKPRPSRPPTRTSTPPHARHPDARFQDAGSPSLSKNVRFLCLAHSTNRLYEITST